MIPLRAYAGQRVAIFALTRSGLAAARALKAGGAAVSVWDEDPARRQAAHGLGLCVEDPTSRDWSDLALVIVGDPRSLSDEPAPRLVQLAQALDVELACADSFLGAQLAREEGAVYTPVLGRAAPAAATVCRHLLKTAGQPAAGPDLSAAPAVLTPRMPVLHILDCGVQLHRAPCLVAALDGAHLDAASVAHIQDCKGPVILSADDPKTRRLRVGLKGRAWLVSGRSTLACGVFVAAGRLFDALDGPARRVATLTPGSALALTQPLAIAAGYAMARALGVSFEEAREAMASFAGAPGQGAPLCRIGRLAVSDWSQARDPRDLVDALRAPGPVVWIGGPCVDPDHAALLEAAGATPAAIFLPADRRRAQRKLARLCPVRIDRQPLSLAMRAVHAALSAGRDARVVYAPGGPEGADFAAVLQDAFAGLVRTAHQGDVA